MMFLGLIALGLLVYLLLANNGNIKGPFILKSKTAEEILKERLAKGEINIEEYKRIKEDLTA